VDDDGSIFEAGINAIAKAGVTRGCNPPATTLFCPDGYVTRGQMAAFLTRSLKFACEGEGLLRRRRRPGVRR